MEIFKDAKSENAYLKCGIQGFAGSGKSFSGAMLAIGLHEYVHSKKPIFFFDTETGADYLKKHFDKKGIGLKIARTRSFVDLVSGTDQAEKDSDILVIDSITHFWTELITAYGIKKGKKRLTLKDWSEIKPEWRQFTDKFLNSHLHIIMLGRAGWDFDQVVDDEGVKELTRTGTKMKVETDLAFEPSISLEMERVRANAGRIGSAFDYRLWVLKDRANLVNGEFRTFPPMKDDKLVLGSENPVFKFILPHIQALNLGGDHTGIAPGGKTSELFNSDRSVAEMLKRRDIALEEIKDEMTLAIPGRDQESTKTKLELLKTVFDTTSWTAIESMPLAIVKGGLDKIRALVKQIPKNEESTSAKGGKK